MPEPTRPVSLSCQELSDRLKAEALRLGFDDVGIAPAIVAPGYPEFLRWLDSGHDAGMAYLRRQEPGRSHPSSLLEGVRSIVVVSVVYKPKEAAHGTEGPRSTQGKVACYARGADYHRVLWDKLGSLLDWLRSERPDARGRAVADTAPLLERDYARLAGLGWIGKNTMLISRRLGSFTFLGACSRTWSWPLMRPTRPTIAGGVPDASRLARPERSPVLISSTRGDASATGPSSIAD